MMFLNNPLTRKNLLVFLVPFLILLLQSCETSRIVSNKSAEYNQHPKKIYLIISSVKQYNAFCSGLNKVLKDKLRAKGIQVDGYLRDPLSLETQDDIDKKIATFSPDAVLVMKQTVTGNYNGGAFLLIMTDQQTKKDFWKGEFKITSGSSPNNDDAASTHKSAKVIINKLVEDKVIE